jgi:hypothetical protein
MAGQKDSFPGSESSILGPANRWVAITPGAGDLVEIPKAIQNTGTAGTVTCTGDDGVSGILYAAQGQVLAVRPRKITAVGAGVTIVALY